MRITALLFQSYLVWRGLTMVLTDFLLGIPRGVACCGCVYLPLFPRWSLTTAPKPYGFTAYGRRCRSCVICSCSKDCKFVSRATMHARRAEASVSKSGPDVDLDGRPAGHQPPIQWSQGVPVLRGEHLQENDWCEAKASTRMCSCPWRSQLQQWFADICRCEINTDGIPNSTVWESVTREPPQPGNHLEPAGNPHRNLRTTTSGTS